MGCRTTDYLLSRLLKSPDMPPFIGLASVREDLKNSAFEKLRDYLQNDPNRISNLFRQFPYVSAWCVTQSLSEEYGDKDQAIYRHIEGAFGVSLEGQSHRTSLYKSFCLVCERLGLPTKGFNRMVDVYLLHAGVPLRFLPNLIQGFLRQEASFGPPPTQANVLLNRWENDSLEFLPLSIKTPQRAILWDETAWHAALYAKIRQHRESFKPKIPIEERFFQILKELEKSGRLVGTEEPGSAVSLPKPRLIWRSDGLSVRFPMVEGRVQLWLDEDNSPLRLRGGEDWILPQPWPTLLRWRMQEFDGALQFLATPDGMTIFDRMTGYVVKEIAIYSTEVEVDTTDAVILSRRSFSIDGKPALEIGDSAFVAYLRLGGAPVDLVTEEGVTQLRARPHRRLIVRDGEVADGPQGALYGPSSVVEVETGLERTEARQLRVTVSQKTTDIEIKVVNGRASITMNVLFSQLHGSSRPDPLLMRLDLLAPADGGVDARVSGISFQCWVWPAFTRINGTVFESDIEPENFVLEQSQHVNKDSRGCLSLDASGGYVSARAVFEIEGQFIPFVLPWPDIVVTRRRPDGTVTTLPIGTRLTVDGDNRFDTVTIRCPDPLATLLVRGRLERSPFAHGISRNLAIRDLLEAATDNKVILRRGNGAELMLFELVPSIEPVSIQTLPSKDLRLRLNLRSPVDALALEIEDENGDVEFKEAGFGRRPVSSRRPSWLSVELPNGDPTEVELTVSALEFVDGLALARIFLRPEDEVENQGMWRPLRNSRGDTYAIILDNPEFRPIDEVVRRRFQTLSKWLADCYATDCWSVIETPLTTRWKELGRTLAKQPGGRGMLMMAGAVSPPDHTVRSWIPLLHPIHLLPDLYTASTSDFAGLSGSSDPGVAELAKLFSLGRSRLREQKQLDPTVYLAFQNLLEATNKDEPLSGFEPERFFKNLPLLDQDPSAGWFWRGTTILGPDHWRAAHLRFVERLEEVGMFTGEEEEGGVVSRRQEALHRLSQVVWEMTPDAERPPVPPRSADQEEPHRIDLWVAACLSGFGRASRMGQVDDFIGRLQHRLGRSAEEVLGTMALLLRLAPELFAFFLLTWQIAKDRP